MSSGLRRTTLEPRSPSSICGRTRPDRVPAACSGSSRRVSGEVADRGLMPCSRLSAGGLWRWYPHGCGLLHCHCKALPACASSAKNHRKYVSFVARPVGRIRMRSAASAVFAPAGAPTPPFNFRNIREFVRRFAGDWARQRRDLHRRPRGEWPRRETSTPRQSLLGLKRRRPAVFHDRWRIPLAGQCL